MYLIALLLEARAGAGTHNPTTRAATKRIEISTESAHGLYLRFVTIDCKGWVYPTATSSSALETA